MRRRRRSGELGGGWRRYEDAWHAELTCGGGGGILYLGYSRVSLYTTVQQDLLRTQEGGKEFREIGKEYHRANTHIVGAT